VPNPSHTTQPARDKGTSILLYIDNHPVSISRLLVPYSQIIDLPPSLVPSRPCGSPKHWGTGAHGSSHRSALRIASVVFRNFMPSQSTYSSRNCLLAYFLFLLPFMAPCSSVSSRIYKYRADPLCPCQAKTIKLRFASLLYPSLRSLTFLAPLFSPLPYLLSAPRLPVQLPLCSTLCSDGLARTFCEAVN
jgi:hypothetical protein